MQSCGILCRSLFWRIDTFLMRHIYSNLIKKPQLFQIKIHWHFHNIFYIGLPRRTLNVLKRKHCATQQPIYYFSIWRPSFKFILSLTTHRLSGSVTSHVKKKSYFNHITCMLNLNALVILKLLP